MTIYEVMTNEIKTCNLIRYLKTELQALTSHNNDGDIKEVISRSSQNSITIVDNLMNEKRNKVNSNMVKLANLTLENVLPKGFFRDTKYKNYLVTVGNMVDQSLISLWHFARC